MNRNGAMSPIYGTACMVVSIVYAFIGLPRELAGLFAMIGYWFLGCSVGMSLAGRGGGDC